MDEKVDFGKILKELRLEKGWSQSELAKLINISQDTISLWERGCSYPDFIMLKKMRNIFGVSADYLFGEADY